MELNVTVAQFWWLVGISVAVIVAMLGLFRRKHWI